MKRWFAGGVPLPVIIRAIKTAANIQFFVDKERYVQLTHAGESTSAANQIMDAMHQRIDSVRLSDGEKVALRGVKNMKGGGHAGSMTTGIVFTALVVWPVAPLFLPMET